VVDWECRGEAEGFRPLCFFVLVDASYAIESRLVQAKVRRSVIWRGTRFVTRLERAFRSNTNTNPFAMKMSIAMQVKEVELSAELIMM
jgi:hypothetical protein